MSDKKIMNIPFSPPDITEAEINEVVDTLRSGWITLPAHVSDCSCIPQRSAAAAQYLLILYMKTDVIPAAVKDFY